MSEPMRNFLMPEELKTEFKIEDDGEIRFFRTKVYELEFDGDVVWAQFSVEVYHQITTLRRKRVGLIPFKYEVETEHSWEHIVTIGTGRYYTDSMVVDGGRASKDMRNDAIGYFANSGIMVSKEVLERCFGPIEKEVLELQRKVFEYARGQ